MLEERKYCLNVTRVFFFFFFFLNNTRHKTNYYFFVVMIVYLTLLYVIIRDNVKIENFSQISVLLVLKARF